MAKTRKSAADRRQQIAGEALRILGEGGRKALTTAALARRVEVTTGAIFRHFPTLDDVIDDAVRIAVARVEATFPGADLDPRERILALARNRIRVLGQDAGIAWLLRSEQASLQLPPASLQELQQLVRRSKAFVKDALREGMAQGSIRDDVGAEELFVVVMGTIHTLIGVAGVHGKSRGRAPSVRRTLDALRTLLSPPPETGEAQDRTLNPGERP